MTAAFQADGQLPAASLALEASAGTGKTWTLTSLTVRYVAEGVVELPELLLVTFTRAATAELKDRVRRRLAEALAATERALLDPERWRQGAADAVLDRIVGDGLRAEEPVAELEARARRLRTAIGQLDEATISTIHGFCQAMLHHAALEAGVDFDAVLLEDDADLLGELVDDRLALELRAADPDWIRYLQDTASVGRERLTRLAREVAALPTLQLQPAHPAPSEPDWQPWQDALRLFADRWRDDGPAEAVRLVTALQEAEAFDKPRQRTYTEAAVAARRPEIDDWVAAAHPLPPGPLDSRRELHRQPDHPYAYLTSRAIGPFLRDGVALPDTPVVAAADELLAAVTAPATRFLHRSATWFRRELELRKRQRTVLTFDDLLRRLADALDDPASRQAVHAAIRQRFRVALIDEFQDTDPVQWRIFSSLFGEEEPFILIGDPKQAIYGFRGADVHTYVHARDTRPSQATLATSFRSDARFVTACNHLFGQPGAFGTSDIPYHEVRAHHPDRLHDPAERAGLQVRLIAREAGEVTPAKDRPGLLQKGWADRELPRDVAVVAVDLLTGGLRLVDGRPAGGDRPVAPRDLAVLVRTNRRAVACQRALQAAGVPAVIQRGGSVFDTAEAEAVARLLTAMLRPSWQRAAVAAAATPLFGRRADALATQLAALDTPAGTAASEPDAPPVAGDGGWEVWVDALTRWGELWQRRGVLAAVQTALLEDGVPERLLAHDDGDRRLTNVRHLLELLHTEETTARSTGYTLLEWFQARRAEAADGEQATAATELRLEQDAEAVRIVTIHGSKGLQYPIVLCPDLWDGRDRTDQRLTRYHEPDVDDPTRAITLDLDVDRYSAGKRRSLDLARWEARTEQLRLAYVAVTRAQHRCIVWWGGFTDAGTSALASLLHGAAVAGPVPSGRGDERQVTAGWLQRIAEHLAGADDDVLLRDLHALAGRSEGTIDVEAVRAIAPEVSWSPEPVARPPLVARRMTRTLDRSWRRASFTSLVRDAGSHPAGPSPGEDLVAAVIDQGRDVDAEAEPLDATLEGGLSAEAGTPGLTDHGGAEPAVQVPLAAFPRGAGPGTFLHDVLEHLDFTRLAEPGYLDGVIALQEPRHGIDPALRDRVRTGLTAALTTSLGPVADGHRLAELQPRDRLDELRFELPVAGGHHPKGSAFTLTALAERCAGSADPLVAAFAPRLRDPELGSALRGYLTGSIDLLARLPDGRFLVADYKSNWLGDRATGRSVAADYRPARLAEAMLAHHYVLQGLLYLVAAHRYLRWRVPGYAYDTHVTGAGYLFLRGMVGLPEARTGIAVLRPEPTLVEDLSALLDGGRA